MPMRNLCIVLALILVQEGQDSTKSHAIVGNKVNEDGDTCEKESQDIADPGPGYEEQTHHDSSKDNAGSQVRLSQSPKATAQPAIGCPATTRPSSS